MLFNDKTLPFLYLNMPNDQVIVGLKNVPHEIAYILYCTVNSVGNILKFNEEYLLQQEVYTTF